MFLILVSNASAFTFLNIYVDETGEALFLGETDKTLNLPEGVNLINGRISGTTQSLTNKQGELWMFSYFLEGAEINVILPEGAVIKSVSEGEISLDNNRISIFVLERIEVSYITEDQLRDLTYIPVIVIMVAILLILIVFLINYGKREKDEKKKERNRAKRKRNKDKLDIIKEVLSEREKLIIEKLKETEKVKSSYLRKLCDIPKASFSRHVQELEKKGLIKRTGEGKNKFVELVK